MNAPDGYQFETRPCSECMYFKDMPYDIPICRRLLMAITKDFQVCYNIQTGTCFIPKKAGEPHA